MADLSLHRDRHEARYWNGQGEAFFDQGALNQAISAFRLATRLDPGWARPIQNLAEVSARKGWELIARNLYSRALEIDAEGVARWHGELALRIPEREARALEVRSPVFVVGCPHSGTTILSRLIGSHPAIVHAEESETRLFSRAPAEIGRVLREWDHRCLAASGRRWIEKSVIHTFQIGRILSFRPYSRFLVARRDGRDVVCSLKSRRYTYRHFEDLIRVWICFNKATLLFSDQPQFHVVHYEELIERPRRTLQRICDFLEEEFSEEMLDFHREPIFWGDTSDRSKPGKLGDRQSHVQLRNWQINQPLFKGSGRWHGEMSPEEKDLFKQRAQAELVRFGYAEDDSW
jgi:hypothetical protein